MIDFSSARTTLEIVRAVEIASEIEIAIGIGIERPMKSHQAFGDDPSTLIAVSQHTDALFYESLRLQNRKHPPLSFGNL